MTTQSDISTVSFDGYFSLIYGDDLIIQQCIRALIEAGILDLLNEQLDTTIMGNYAANAENMLNDLETIVNPEVSVSFTESSETVSVTASVTKRSDGKELTFVYTVPTLTIDILF